MTVCIAFHDIGADRAEGVHREGRGRIDLAWWEARRRSPVSGPVGTALL